MVQAEGPGSCLTQPPGSAEQEEGGRMTQEMLFEGGRREAVSRQSQAGAASPGETQPERPKDETLLVVGEFAHPPSHGTSALPSLCPRCKALQQGKRHG